MKWKNKGWAIVGFAVNGINSIPAVPLIFGILMLFYFRFELVNNEEEYMQLAKHFINPDWIPNSQNLDEPPGTRLFYQYIVGGLLQFLTFEQVKALGILVIGILVSWPLKLIYDHFKIGNILILFHLPILYLMGARQAFFAGEFMFLTLESKTIAYLFVLWGLYFFLNGRYQLVAIVSGVATYFHILAGGWFIFYFLIFHLIQEKSFFKTTLVGLIYVGCVLPFLIYLFPLIASNVTHVSTYGDLDPDYILTFFRQPQHTALFKSMELFLYVHFGGIIITFIFFLGCCFLFKNIQSKMHLKINLFNVICGLGLMISIAGAYIDQTGAFVKYFPFRINVIFSFLILLQVVFYIKQLFKERPAGFYYFQFGILIWAFLLLTPRLIETGVSVYRYFMAHRDTDFDRMTAYIYTTTAPNDVVMMLPQKSNPHLFTFLPDMDLSFMRKAERDMFASFNFSPIAGGTGRIIPWYNKLLAKKMVWEDFSKICEVRKDFNIQYVLSNIEREPNDCTSLIHQDGKYYLYLVLDEPEE